MQFVILLSLLIIFSSEVPAESNNQSLPLFKSLSYGDQKSSFNSKDGYYDCEKQFGANSICKDDIKFVDHYFLELLNFNNKGLNKVTLFTRPEETLNFRIIGILVKTMSMAMMSDTSDHLDLIELVKKIKTKESLNEAIEKFIETSLTTDDPLTIKFIGMPNSELRQYNSFYNAMGSLPDNTRVAEMTVGGEGENEFLMLVFFYPKLDLSNDVNTIKEQSIEKF